MVLLLLLFLNRNAFSIMSTSKVNCCVVGCFNSYKNSPGTIFYRFPCKPWEKKLRQLWISAVKRELPDGGKWEPNQYTRICSKHFVHGKKVNHPDSPSYVPTIFPKQYRKAPKTGKDVGRFQRAMKRSNVVSTASSSRSTDTGPFEETSNGVEPVPEPFNLDKSVQANFDLIEDNFIFNMVLNNESSKPIQTMCNIPKLGNQLLIGVEKSDAATMACTTGIYGFIGWQSIHNHQQWLDLCGITYHNFLLLLSFLSVESNVKVKTENRLLIFLMKMKLGLTYSSLQVLFGVHRTSISLIFRSVLDQLYASLQNFIFWPTKECVQACLPESFKSHYPNTRVIIDCTEIRTQSPKRVDDRNYLYSNYKGHHTGKFLIAVTPNGMICFISKVYGGRASDAFITNESGLLNLLEPGDVVLADKGFPGIQVKDNIVLVTPPRVHEGHLSVSEVNDTYHIASVRIHVERCIERVKNFSILVHILPTDLFNCLDKIVFVACALTNISPPIIKNI